MYIYLLSQISLFVLAEEEYKEKLIRTMKKEVRNIIIVGIWGEHVLRALMCSVIGRHMVPPAPLMCMLGALN